MLPLDDLLRIEMQWRPAAFEAFPDERRFLPFAATLPQMALGITESGRWAHTRYELSESHPGRVFDPSSKSLIFLFAMLDWTPRVVMDQVNVVASSAGVPFAELWAEFPWRSIVRSALSVPRRRGYVERALDWVTYLGVADEFASEIAAAGVSAQDLVLPRPRVSQF